MTVLAPHSEGVAGSESEGVTLSPFRYAPAPFETVGYSRSLQADERLRGRAALAAPLYLLGARRAVARELRRRRYDLVHAHWIVPNGLAAAAALPERDARGERVAFAIGLHGSDVFLAEKPGVRRLTRWALSRAALLTGCSPELVDRVCALGFPAARARVISYGVDVRAFTPGRGRGLDWRRRLGVPDGALLLLGVGRMATKKGFQVLVRALPGLFAAHPEAHVVLAGGGDLLPDLARAAAGFAGRLHLPGPVLRDSLPDLYRAADLFVLPAVHDRRGNVDGLPNVILEAMASGLPVVASRVSGIPLAVADGETGLLIPEGDAEALLTALLRLLADPTLARRLGEEGRRKAERELTWDAVAARYREAYRAALAPGGRIRSAAATAEASPTPAE